MDVRVRKRRGASVLIEKTKDPKTGKWRERTVYNLAPYSSVGRAIWGAEGDLNRLQAKLWEMEADIVYTTGGIMQDFALGLAKYHGGKLPERTEVLKRAKEIIEDDARIGREGWPDKKYPSDYRDSFRGLDSKNENVGVAEFIERLRKLDWLKEIMRKEWAEKQPEITELQERIAFLKKCAGSR